MTWTLDSSPSQQGRIAIVTGSNIGLGYDTALALAGKGCYVILACRNLDKANTAKAQILTQYPKSHIECLKLDLSSLKSIRSFAKAFAKQHETLDLLINNAGIMMPPYAVSEDGFESQMAANYFGHFALTGLLLPLLTKTQGSRIVSLSSLAHRWGNNNFDDIHSKSNYSKRLAYGNSKLACLMFAYELNRRLRTAGSKTMAVAAHPGVAATNLAQHFPKVMSVFFPLVGQSSAAGALPTLYAALGEDVEGGDFCGPSGWRQMRGTPEKVRSSRASRDEAAAKKLWEMSEQLTKVRFVF
jgi:NAD(P)-dependent dehydrogenase (short-subunit alcohol dehydrogenase family)